MEVFEEVGIKTRLGVRRGSVPLGGKVGKVKVETPFAAFRCVGEIGKLRFEIGAALRGNRRIAVPGLEVFEEVGIKTRVNIRRGAFPLGGKIGKVKVETPFAAFRCVGGIGKLRFEIGAALRGGRRIAVPDLEVFEEVGIKTRVGVRRGTAGIGTAEQIFKVTQTRGGVVARRGSIPLGGKVGKVKVKTAAGFRRRPASSVRRVKIEIKIGAVFGKVRGNAVPFRFQSVKPGRGIFRGVSVPPHQIFKTGEPGQGILFRRVGRVVQKIGEKIVPGAVFPLRRIFPIAGGRVVEIERVERFGAGRLKIPEKLVKRRFVARLTGIVLFSVFGERIIPETVLSERILLEIVFIGMGHLYLRPSSDALACR